VVIIKKIFLIVLLIILISGCSLTGEIVEIGDSVSVNYVGKFDDGMVFDTSLQEVAENPLVQKTSTFNPKPVYTPFKFTVGSGQVIPGFDEGVLGMKESENKEIVIPPEMGYGTKDEELIEILPRIYIIDVIENVPKHDFSEETGVTKFNETDIVPWRDWTAEVVVVTADFVIIRNLANDSTVNTEIGTIETKVETGTITQIFTPLEGVVVNDGQFSAVNDTYFIVDYNHPLAGQTLTFEVTVETIEKAD
jgi:FKBP-type peptidyl-prolyl cis-trans isomerase 2